ncbi:hypothetical protein A4H97_31200 [Niastella yeongjuensis]|uniref:DUF5977 domain-containing protein n=1 Tax=Niastella yeongjuensis TaxID=354355 RepID=A0A1V9EJJ2_9BACT|nr:DUF5977 domain-containing protein [Niastella yeongjuensis]OQP46231.1 hypothetical protein A4H97_31200 [Niastella yeongjuensis]SEP46014.1 YD repeat-containing protein [Niastella yeongjuensis]
MLHATRRFQLIFYSLLLLFITNANGQPNYKLPVVLNPSPVSQAFTRYGDYPMSDYTGLTDITIPIHTVTGKKLSLPITMSFHASGRMANDINGTLGLRWTLNCGGLITRTVKGAPDEWNYLEPYVVNPDHVPSYDELYGACPDGKFANGPFYDTEFDIFNYSLPNGKHGHFILKDENGVKKPMFIPLDPLKLEFKKSETTSNGLYDWIDITDVDGTRYRFGKIDATTTDAIETTANWDTENGLLGGNIPTAWYLVKIISSDGADEISLSYFGRTVYPYYSSESATVYDRNRDDENSTFWQTETIDPYSLYLRDLLVAYHFETTGAVVNSGTDNPYVPALSGIQFNGGSVAFSYTQGGPFDKLLTEITVSNGSGPYKKVKFATSKHAGEAELFYLDNVSFYGEDPSLVNEKYNFSYYEGYVEPLRYSAGYKDWWGYYSNSAGLLPAQTIAISPLLNIYLNSRDIGNQVSRQGDEDYKKMGMLRTITYPTGGQTEFVYEGNRYANYPYYQPPQNTATLEGPGLRIKEVISKPGNGGKDIHKLYKYGVYEDGRGYINELLRPGSLSQSNLMVAEGNCMHFWLWQDPTASPPFYGGESQTGYRTRDYFGDPYLNFDLSGTQIKYQTVSEYLMEDDVPKQKTTNSYSWNDDEQISSFIVNDREEPIYNHRMYVNPENAWITAVLANKSIYKYKDNQFSIIRNEAYNYDYIGNDQAWDMPTYIHTNVVYSRTTSSSAYHEIDKAGWKNSARYYHNNFCSVYGYGYRHFTSSKQEVYHSVIEEYTPNGMIRTEKNFDYDQNTILLKSEELVNSKNEVVKTTYKYPYNFSTVPVYNGMIQKNIISPVIEATTTVNGVQAKKTVTNYYNPSSNVFVPQSVENQTGNKPQEVIANFNRYDNLGHVLEQQKANNVKEVYLWGYQLRYPVAKILNSTYDAAIAIVPQSVLDAAGNGNDGAFRNSLNSLRQSLPGALVETYTYKPFVGMTSSTDANGRTTYYEYDGFGRLIHLRDKDNNIVKKYCYNYTGQAESCPLNGNTAKSGTFIKNGCTAGNAGVPVTYTVPANTYFGPNADALAQNDVNANGQAYADKNGTCVIASYNVAKSQPFTKNNCVEGGVGSSVTYSVPANKYAAYNLDAANQLAQNEIDANGQNYANANGYCTWYNAEQHKDFTKNNCGGQPIGTTVTYSVPAYSYSSTTSQDAANQLALDDLDQNGQTYANTWGDCIDQNAHLLFQNHGNDGIDIWFYNYDTEDQFFIVIPPNASEVPLSIPAGKYKIDFAPDTGGDRWHFYELGCGHSWGGIGGITFDPIYLSIGTDCNSFSFD